MAVDYSLRLHGGDLAGQVQNVWEANPTDARYAFAYTVDLRWQIRLKSYYIELLENGAALHGQIGFELWTDDDGKPGVPIAGTRASTYLTGKSKGGQYIALTDITKPTVWVTKGIRWLVVTINRDDASSIVAPPIAWYDVLVESDRLKRLEISGTTEAPWVDTWDADADADTNLRPLIYAVEMLGVVDPDLPIPEPIARHLFVTQPLILVYQDDVIVSRLRFSERDNQAVVHGPFKRPYSLAEPTTVEGGRIYTHQRGVYYRYRVEYQVRMSNECYENRVVGNLPQFTEYEIGLLDTYASQPDVYDVLFYPHTNLPGIGQSNDPNYRVQVLLNDADRPTIAQNRVTAVLEVESIMPVMTPRMWL